LACQKRPVSLARIEELVKDVQARLLEMPDREVRSRELGELVMEELKGLDHVAYVRFASVYREFKDLPDFVKAFEGLIKKEARGLPEPTVRQPLPAPPGQPTPLFPGVEPGGPKKGRGRR
jgi:transcriptional repressor NrdR